MYEQQSIEPDQANRKKLVWEIDRRLQEDAARPMIFNYRLGPAVTGGARDHDHGQQPVQWLALRGCLARPIAPEFGTLARRGGGVAADPIMIRLLF
jgi:hypothetical protein